MPPASRRSLAVLAALASIVIVPAPPARGGEVTGAVLLWIRTGNLAPSEVDSELGMTVAAMGAGAEGARRARIALAGLPGYGSY